MVACTCGRTTPQHRQLVFGCWQPRVRRLYGFSVALVFLHLFLCSESVANYILIAFDLETYILMGKTCQYGQLEHGAAGIHLKYHQKEQLLLANGIDEK